MTSLPIILPDGFAPVVNEGDNIIVGQIIASYSQQDEEIINIPQELAIKKSQVKNALKKIPGEKVKIGDILASKNSFFGGSTFLKSRAEGTVIKYERDSGNLVIKKLTSAISKNIVSRVDGIVSVCNNKEIQINTDKNVLVGKKASGISAQGEILVLGSDDPYHIDSGTIEKIIVGDKFTREMLLKGIGIGVSGIVGSDIKDEDIEHIEEKRFETPIIEISKDDLKKLKEWKNKSIFLNIESKSIIFLS